MTQYNPDLFSQEEGAEFAQQHPDLVQQQMEEEAARVSDINLESDRLREPHQHQPHRTRAIRDQIAGAKQICACGAHRDVSLMRSSKWVGGNPPENPWDQAHLEAVRRAVENTPPLLLMHPEVVQDINQALTNDPPQGSEGHDMEALAIIYGMARGAAARLLKYHQGKGS